VNTPHKRGTRRQGSEAKQRGLREGSEKLLQLSLNPPTQSECANLKIPRPDKESVDLFQSLVPKDDRVTVRPMFGNISAFVNGNMFFGVFGSDLFVRLSSEDQLDLLKNKDSSMLEPMKGKPMKDYVVLPKTWRAKPEALRSWISKSLEWSSKLPPKKAKK
jgi:TfoX/Sxy family transcriptional regulator of competence genes